MKKLLLAIMVVIAGFGLVACDIEVKPPLVEDGDIPLVPLEPSIPNEEDKEDGNIPLVPLEPSTPEEKPEEDVLRVSFRDELLKYGDWFEYEFNFNEYKELGYTSFGIFVDGAGTHLNPLSIKEMIIDGEKVIFAKSDVATGSSNQSNGTITFPFGDRSILSEVKNVNLSAGNLRVNGGANKTGLLKIDIEELKSISLTLGITHSGQFNYIKTTDFIFYK